MKRRTSIPFLALFIFTLFSSFPSQGADQLYTKSSDGTFQPIVLSTNSSGPFLSGPLVDLLTSVSTWTNLALAPYAIYDTATKKAGAGVLALYNINSYVASGLALQYLNGDVYMPSAQIQFQAPLVIGGKMTVAPLAFTGIGTPIAGRGSDNGTPVGIFGAGLSTKLYTTAGGSRLDAFFAIAKWTGFQGEQWYLGLAWRF